MSLKRHLLNGHSRDVLALGVKEYKQFGCKEVGTKQPEYRWEGPTLEKRAAASEAEVYTSTRTNR